MFHPISTDLLSMPACARVTFSWNPGEWNLAGDGSSGSIAFTKRVEGGRQALSRASFKHHCPHFCEPMLVSDRNLITENYADAGRTTPSKSWIGSSVSIWPEIICLSRSGEVEKATDCPLRRSHPVQTAYARVQGLRNNLCAATRLGLRFNNLNSGLTIVDFHASHSGSAVGQTVVCGGNNSSQIRPSAPHPCGVSDRPQRASPTVMCHLMICILATGMR
jgi:hypothetical protein